MAVVAKNKDPSPAIARVKSPKSKVTKKAKPSNTKESNSLATKQPTYLDMIQEAISTLKEQKGSSRQAILKWILSNYELDEKTAKVRFKLSFRQGLENGILVHGKCNLNFISH
jgi:hypothetical protein